MAMNFEDQLKNWSEIGQLNDNVIYQSEVKTNYRVHEQRGSVIASVNKKGEITAMVYVPEKIVAEVDGMYR